MDFLAQNDITALLGNLLENAVEAAANLEKPYIELIIGSNRDRLRREVLCLPDELRRQ